MLAATIILAAILVLGAAYLAAPTRHHDDTSWTDAAHAHQRGMDAHARGMDAHARAANLWADQVAQAEIDALHAATRHHDAAALNHLNAIEHRERTAPPRTRPIDTSSTRTDPQALAAWYQQTLPRAIGRTTNEDDTL